MSLQHSYMYCQNLCVGPYISVVIVILQKKFFLTGQTWMMLSLIVQGWGWILNLSPLVKIIWYLKKLVCNHSSPSINFIPDRTVLFSFWPNPLGPSCLHLIDPISTIVSHLEPCLFDVFRSMAFDRHSLFFGECSIFSGGIEPAVALHLAIQA